MQTLLRCLYLWAALVVHQPALWEAAEGDAPGAPRTRFIHSWAQRGATGLAIPTAKELGPNHGVYQVAPTPVDADPAHKHCHVVTKFWQKATVPEMAAGGAVRADSAPGRGTTITILLAPARGPAPAPHVAPLAVPAPRLKGRSPAPAVR